MSNGLVISADWERLDGGSPEDRATFAAVGIRHNNIWLTEAEDSFVNRVRSRVHLSAYRLAEWLAWNWWRLRWEPHRESAEWAMAHRMTTIGGGYVWPNISIFSDGERIVLNAQPTARRAAEPLRYICQIAAVVRAVEFEGAVDSFVTQVIGQLKEAEIRDSNLGKVWADLLDERRDSDVARYRKLEALLGYDVGEAKEDVISALIEDSVELGEPAIEELAADRDEGSPPVTSTQINELALCAGFETNPRDAVKLKNGDLLPHEVAAWKRGVAAAASLRSQEHLGAAPISNDRLSQLAGIPKAALGRDQKSGALSFALDDTPTKGSVVLRSKYETGRRFNVARLIGDRIGTAAPGKLIPATRSYTYRQKLQRAFAAEFLCPFDAVADILHGDFSAEAMEDVAEYFNVSERTVRTLLANHKLIERDELMRDFDLAA